MTPEAPAPSQAHCRIAEALMPQFQQFCREQAEKLDHPAVFPAPDGTPRQRVIKAGDGEGHPMTFR